MKTNLDPITKGDTYTFTIEAFDDESEATAIDISGYTFTMTAVYANGSAAFNKSNSGFVSTTNFKRTVTLSDTDTSSLSVGELYYQIDVTYPDSTKEQWMDGYIIVKA